MTLPDRAQHAGCVAGCRTVMNLVGLTRIEGHTMPNDNARIAFKIVHVFEGQAEGYFAVGILAVLALATLACAMIYLMRRRAG